MKRMSVVRMVSAWFFVLAFTSAANASQATLVGDAHVDQARPSTNFGYLSNLNVGGGYTALLTFDIGGLPSGVTSSQIARATLTVFVNRVNTAGTVSITPVTSAWSEATVTAASLPALGHSAGSFYASAPGQFVTLDVTSLVQGWLTDPSSNYGVALASTTANVLLDSKESGQTSHSALLDITVTSVGPTGAPGPQGSPGFPGLPGIQGVPGLQGLPGLQGTAGLQGLPGLQGTAGIQGIPGIQGVTGLIGPIGPVGPIGAGGPIGAAGPAGPIGAAGAVGVNFTGAYSSATTYHLNDAVTFNNALYIDTFSGSITAIPPTTVQQWSVLLPQGITGATGAPGDIGPAGAMGLIGGPGPAGPIGAAGAVGVNFTGAYSSATTYHLHDAVTFNNALYIDTFNGSITAIPPTLLAEWSVLLPQGTTGATGDTGSAGPMGAPGTAGAIGPAGPVGPAGPIGATGASGGGSSSTGNAPAGIPYSVTAHQISSTIIYNSPATGGGNSGSGINLGEFDTTLAPSACTPSYTVFNVTPFTFLTFQMYTAIPALISAASATGNANTSGTWSLGTTVGDVCSIFSAGAIGSIPLNPAASCTVTGTQVNAGTPLTLVVTGGPSGTGTFTFYSAFSCD